LALAYVGDNAKAIEHLEAYLAAMPGAPDTAEVQAKIAELRE
jgi:regulator of sirC expression with transglutaminase-like and TPR domain